MWLRPRVTAAQDFATAVSTPGSPLFHHYHTLQDYAMVMHIPAPSSHRYAELSLGLGNACGDPGNIEEQLDVESSYDMATPAKQPLHGFC